MKVPTGMTRRLMLWLTAGMVLFWVAAVGLGGLIMREEFDEIYDSALRETAQRLMPLVVNDLFQHERLTDPLRMNGSGTEGEESLTYQLRDKEGRVVLHSHDGPREPFGSPLTPGFSNTPTHRVYTEAAVSGTLFLQVAHPLAERREATLEGALSLTLPLILLVPLSMAVIWIVVRHSLDPIGVLRDRIGERDGGNLAAVGTVGLPAELETIATSVDKLLERLRASLDAEREFAANSAHELRTPIAGALAQTQRLIAELPDGPTKRRAEGIETALSSLAHLAEKLLQLSRADAGIGTSSHLTDLAPVVRTLVEEFSRKPGNATRLRLDVAMGVSLMRKVDIDAFGIALRNLIENALTHGAADVPVVVAVKRDGTVAVTNGGATIPPNELQQLAMRFKRGATATRGSGLGLAIAETLTRRMGGTLEFRSPAGGRNNGFEATIRV
ncbi:MAG: HAMP domain-containing histidine kinase [Mesorhizobium sp.]|nr:MAG: HAMP domain-containing histidine kinase [Mesorhizobium sp.]